MNNISELRRELKTIGYNIKTKSNSMGTFATYIRIESGEKLTGNVFTLETLKNWKPLFDWIRQHNDEISKLRNETGIYGLKGTR